MNIVLHIVRKDLRRLRWPLAAWLATIALHLAVGWALVGGVELPRVSARELELWLGGLRAAGYLLTFVITAMLVQEDGLVGSTQFWLTRPISNRRLLAAKLAGWALLLVVPQLALMAPWWLVCGFGSGDLARAALEVVAIQAAVSLPAALVAALTDTLSRFLVWAFVFVFGAAMMPGALTAVMPNFLRSQESPDLLLFWWLALSASLVAATVRQYLRRETVRSLAWAGTAVVLAPLLAGAAGALLKPRREASAAWTEWRAERVASANVALISWGTGREKRQRDGELELRTVLAVRGLPDELLLDTELEDAIDQTWRWPGGPAVTRPARWSLPWNQDYGALRMVLGVSPERRDEETERVWAERREAQLSPNPEFAEMQRRGRELRRNDPKGVEVFAGVLPSSVQRMRQALPAYEATVRLRAVRPEPWIEMPARAGGWQATRGHGLRIERPGFRLPGVPAAADEAAQNDSRRLPMVTTAAVPLWMALFGPRRYWEYWHLPSFVAFHRAGGEIEHSRLVEGQRFHVGGVMVHVGVARLLPPTVRRGDKWVPRDPNWLDGARIALVGYREEARFTREVKLERLPPMADSGRP